MTIHDQIQRRYRTVALVCLALGALCVSCINCASSGLSRGLQVGVVVAGVADVHSTSQALASSCCVEANPLMRGSDAKRAAWKAVATAGLIWMGREWEQRHPVVSRLLMGAAIVAWGAAAHHNYGLVR